MSDKQDILEAISEKLKENNLNYIMLHNAITSKWPEPRKDPYSIRELVIVDDRIQVWQGPGFKDQHLIVYLDEFGYDIISRVYLELLNTISQSYQYRVMVNCYIDLPAVSPEHAEQMVASERFPNIKDHLLRFEVAHDTHRID